MTQHLFRSISLTFLAFLATSIAGAQQSVVEVRQITGSNIAWAGAGNYRLLVDVAPASIGQRPRDEAPASLKLDFNSILPRLGAGGRHVDLASIQVIRYSPETGGPLLPGTSFLHGRSRYDRPLRWYDASIPNEFPEVLTPVSRTHGELRRTPQRRVGYVYNTLGDGEAGELAWLHAQNGGDSSHYAIYFDLLPGGERMRQVPPSGWLGDGMPRTDRWGESTTGSGHTRIALDDWNDNGLVDIIQGEEYGRLFVYPNQGTPEEPAYPFRKLLFDAEGLPLDVGIHAAPLVVDWDGDGVKDLLVGTYVNRIVYFKNVGTNRDRQLVYQGFLTIGGEVLELPVSPVVGRSEAVFDHDYYPVLEVVDWTGNGRKDLLAGGYVTGRIYLYENLGPGAGGQPRLAFRGPIEAEGKPINVGDWCAAPLVADFTGDGKLDLITGGLAMTPASRSTTPFLRYYRNHGAPGTPRLVETELPTRGDIPRGAMATPRAADLTNNGLLDLVVSSNSNIFIFRNVGTPTEPLFEMHRDFIPSSFGNAPLAVQQFIDWNGDGLPDLVSRRYSVQLNSGEGNPYRFDETVRVLPPGQHIAHPSGVGDDWFWPFLSDFTGNGKIDVLFGDWHGHVWLHRNLSTDTTVRFDLPGERLQTVDGKPIKVGPQNVDNPETNFIALQGARTVFTVGDFDGDGVNDLVVGDTFGLVRYFRNAGGNDQPVFESPVEVGNLGFRLLVDAFDWNGNGRLDIIAGAANGRVRIFQNITRSGPAEFDPGSPLELPPIRQPRILMVDLNADGDDDLFLPSTQGSVWIERSFLEEGYRRGEITGIESKNPNRPTDP